MLKSVSSVTEAVKLIKDVRSMCAAGGFRLTKFVSNSHEVISSVPGIERAKDFVVLDLSDMPVERALGVHWCIQNDSFVFRINLQDKPLTRRGMLSTVSSIFDPLGFAAPFLLEGKRLLQQVCNSNTGWDDDLKDDHRSAWERWRLNLPSLERIEVQRSFKPSQFHGIRSATLHHFSDASQLGYGQCSYMRLVDGQGTINCSLVMGKSRVAPWKPVTVPRLELSAACVSAKVGHMLETELQYDSLTSFYWTDSNAVLGYINNDARRFHTFVANRVQLIRETSQVESWRYVNTLDNPADDASRGIEMVNISSEHRWFKGPEFIWMNECHWPPAYQPNSDAETDPEIKKIVRAVQVDDRIDLIQQLEARVSNWYRLRKYIAIWIRFTEFIQNKSAVRRGTITVQELNQAEVTILQSTQRRFFPVEVQVLSMQSENPNARILKRSSHLIKLDPFMDESGLIRVGGRLSRSLLDEGQQHPIIVPKTSRVAMLISQWCHDRVQHGGRGLTLNEIRRSGYWIIAGNSVVRHLINKCVSCRIFRGKANEQKMADLPFDRVNPAPPFTYCAVDLFGPFIIKEGRKEVKRYGCLFTCLACRAIHIETTNSMDTSSFINALRRFIARRGNIRELRSDNGSNFVGAESELKKAWQEMNHTAVNDFLHKNTADFIIWKRNPPTASHMGGVWERQIRSVRAVLSSLLKQHGHLLDDELFRTLLTEVETIVNSRPLTVESLSDASSPCPLTPSHLLTMKSNVVMPPAGIFQRTDLYCRQRWRRVQHIANEFWSRWNKEYLVSLQPRPKNQTVSRNLKIGDIVLLKESDTARNDWPLAKVIDTHFDEHHKCVRSVTLRMATRDLNSERSIKVRPVNKTVLLLEVDRP
jgi:Pao retrotransposon peptidase/Family of unknown function (DUF5641)